MSAAVQLPAPTGLTARYQGPYSSNNNTTYYYWLQALYVEGWSALSASYNTGAHAPSSLTGGALVNVQWNPSPGALGYILYRTTTSTAPGYGATGIFIATSETGYKDDGTIATFTQTPRFDGMYVARMIYDFATDGGVHTSAIVPAISDTIPNGAVLWGGTCVCTVSFVGPTNVEVGTTAGSSATSIVAAVGIPAAGACLVCKLFATPVQMSAAGQINMTITVADATAGRLEVTVFYTIPV